MSMPKSSGERAAMVVLLASTFIWSGGFVAIKIALDVVSPSELALLRHFPGAVLLGLYLAIRRRGDVKRVVSEDGWRIALMAFLFIVGAQFCLIWGVSRIPAGMGGLIASLNPVMTYVAGAIVLGEAFSRRRTAGLVVAFVGLFVAVRWGAGSQITWGYWLGVAVSVLAQSMASGYNVVSRRVVSRQDPLLVVGCMLVVGTLPLLALYEPGLLSRMIAAKWSFWASFGFLALIDSVLAVIVFAWALKRLDAARVSSFIFLVPVESVGWAWWLLDEPVTVWLVVGAGVALAGVWLVQGGRR